ncbi:MAG TPA: gamma-glutamyltransferase [Oscillatoriaceae cyanobacterium M33_DOE_052]|uniref:Glutathione hydrolase proenzyme n=1 Tax=Planktothricoides sp. SpSt-374 TaxID=2282167 RepID=A0A7C3VRB3_9CYAN|nr:gamma-glutamyltransferase [Oscillatoriaceae cyanobacterium M33_DOE_052]
MLVRCFLSIALTLTGGGFWWAPAAAAPTQVAQYRQGMVVSAHPLASDVGLAILSAGGNAVDAAVATALAISVVEPFSAGIGGGGFLLLRQEDTGEVRALDFRERAPQKATRDMYLDENGEVIPRASLDGHLAAAVPGTVAGLSEVHRHYGNLPWHQLVEPAITLAEEGFLVKNRFLQFAGRRQEIFRQNAAARAVFTKNGEMYQVGDGYADLPVRLRQPDLAATLRQIAANPQNFYTGDIADKIVRDMAENGGFITREDLQNYQPIWRQPLCGNLEAQRHQDFSSQPALEPAVPRQFRICSMPPPSSGGVHIWQILNIIIPQIASLQWQSADAIHLMAEAMKIAYSDRSQYLGDPDFITIPVLKLISAPYANFRRQQIDMNRARPASEVQPVNAETLERLVQESNDTSHLNVVDSQGNAVSLTFTVNGGFGAGVVAAGTGILLNNEMDDFAPAPGIPNLFGLVGSDANAIYPGKTPLSSMTPTIVTKNTGEERLFMVAGSPGGSTIITTVLQIFLNVAIYNMDAYAALAAPRIHHQWLPDSLYVEPGSLSPQTKAELQRRGHQIVDRDSFSNPNLIIVKDDGTLEAAADPRGEGEPRGF